MVPFWGHFGVVFGAKKCDLRRRFRGRFRHPPGTLRGPKPLKTQGELFKNEGRRFRAREAPGSILGAKMESTARSETQKNRCKIYAEIGMEFYGFFIDFGCYFGADLGAFWASFWHRFSLRFLTSFLNRGHAKSWRRKMTDAQAPEKVLQKFACVFGIAILHLFLQGLRKVRCP